MSRHCLMAFGDKLSLENKNSLHHANVNFFLGHLCDVSRPSPFPHVHTDATRRVPTGGIRLVRFLVPFLYA